MLNVSVAIAMIAQILPLVLLGLALAREVVNEKIDGDLVGSKFLVTY
jgi:hypothetical protein